jgi:hypothetical protein
MIQQLVSNFNAMEPGARHVLAEAGRLGEAMGFHMLGRWRAHVPGT